MTRFARAKGSKASNERKEENPTPWYIMRQQLSEQLNKNDNDSEKKSSLVDNRPTTDKVGLKSKEEMWYEFNEFKLRNPSFINNTMKKTLEGWPKSQDNKTGINVPKLEKSKCIESKSKTLIKKRNTNCESNDSNKSNHVKSKGKSILKTKISKNTIIIQKEDVSLNNNVSMKKNNTKINTECSRKEFNTSKLKTEDTKVIKEQTTLTPLEPLNVETSHELKLSKHLIPNVLKNDNQEKLNNKKGFKKEFQSLPNSRSSVQTIIANGRKIEIIKYEAFWIKKEDAFKLKELKKKLKGKQIPNDKIKNIMKLERRKAEKALSREKTNVCYHCRKFGHKFSECPEINNSSMSKSGICFKCGSTEHTHFECKVTQSQNFRYAVCFVCNEQGHIARQCSLNPQGQYPKGGSCHLCGEVTHLRKDCPKAFEEKPSTFVTVEKINSVELEDLSEMKTNNKQNLVKNKVVHF